MMLPPSVRHRRLVSLSALKARMEPPRPLASPSRLGIEAVSEGDEGEGRMNGSVGLTPTHAPLRKQFGDEIVFCCPACEGDLITL
jgi:hypothetical protein